MIHHKVADYAKWRVAYDTDQPNRTAAETDRLQVQRRSMDDAGDVLISCNMADVAKAKAFASSKTLARHTMSKAGVMGNGNPVPDIAQIVCDGGELGPGRDAFQVNFMDRCGTGGASGLVRIIAQSRQLPG